MPDRNTFIPNVLSIAGSDPSGGAGIQADLKTFAALGCHGMAAITALTAQNTQGVGTIHLPPAAFVAEQIAMIFADIRVDAVKIGMLGDPEVVEVVADRLLAHGATNIVLDPVLVATSGDSLGAPGVVQAMLARLVPMARIVTPNLPEAARLSGCPLAETPDGMRDTAAALRQRGARAALVKGGHLHGLMAVDVLDDGEGTTAFEAERVETRNTHGTGCTLSSAIAAHLARGADLRDAVRGAKHYLTGALRGSDALSVGGGHGPVHHFHAVARNPET